MPLPIPNSSEKENEFISRCMTFMSKEGDKWKQDQKLAICYSQWKKKNESIDFMKYLSENEQTVTADIAQFADKLPGPIARRKKKKNKLTGLDLIIHELKRVDESEDDIDIISLFGRKKLLKMGSKEEAFKFIFKQLSDLGVEHININTIKETLNAIF